MKKQSEIFLDSEGDKWLKRNEKKIIKNIKNDPVIPEIKKIGIKPTSILEVGCSNGWRLKELKKIYKSADTFGIDPAHTGHGYRDGIYRGTAASMPMFRTNSKTIVIYGFCLYLCDPVDYLKIASEGDRVLVDGGYIVIYDFHQDAAYKKRYRHKKGVFSHKMDFSKLWLGSPVYSLFSRRTYGDYDEQTSVTIIQKDIAAAFQLKRW